MRFGVLGPLAVWTSNGHPVAVPELKVRALLADLLAHDGRTVSTARLIDDLWGEEQPANPANALQMRVSLLRRALDRAESGARELVVSEAPGYALRVPPDAVDARRFRDLFVRALHTDAPRGRHHLLSEALALWRGPAYADFEDAGFARAAIDRLEEERAAAHEEDVGTRLVLGDDGLLTGELAHLVARYPLRQRLRGSYMVALYRAGRHEEALGTFAQLRDRLAEELGLDPSSDLVALHQQVLRQDPGLDAGPSTPTALPGTNLPTAVAELIGRESAVAAVRSRVESHRMVTLVGPGGVGKTRLALEVARHLVDDFGDGVWFVELTPIDPDTGREARSATIDVAQLVAGTLGLRGDGATPGGSPTDSATRLTAAVRDRRALLVLDNCEHVLDQVGPLCARLLQAAPTLQILSTSREPLGAPGENLWSVPPLDLPDIGPDVAPETVIRASSARLFLARVEAVLPGYTLSAGDAGPTARICRQLDGIPLALELAATRLRAMSMTELAERLDDRFRVLSVGRRALPARQRTLEAVVDWSWSLLTESERIVLRRLAVCVDGCTRREAAEICAGDGVDADDVFGLLADLVDRSLVVPTTEEEGTRYRLLETIRAYGLRRLEETHELEAARRRHTRCYLGVAERAEAHLYGRHQERWLARLDADAANLRAAVDNAVRNADGEVALRLVNALGWYWFLRGRLEQARRSFERALETAGAARSSAREVAKIWLAGITLLRGDVSDTERRQAAETLAENMVDRGGPARAQWFVGYAHRGARLSRTMELLDRALVTLRGGSDRWAVAAALSVRATASRARGDLVEARRDAEASEAIFRELGDRWGRLKATNSLAELAEVAGDYERAAQLHQDGVELAERLGMWGEVSLRLSGLGRIALLNGDDAAAERFHRRAMRLASEQANAAAEEFAELGLALGCRRQGRLDAAEAHLRRWLDWLRQLDRQPGVPLVLTELGFIAELRGETDAALAWQSEAVEAARDTEDPRAIALALEGLAGAYALAGDGGRAARLLGHGSALRKAAGAPLPAAERRDVDRGAAAARALVGAAVFAAEFDRGAVAPIDELLRP